MATCTAPATCDEDGLLRQAFQQQEKEMKNHKQYLSPKELQAKYEQRTECARQIHAMYNYFDAMSPAVFASSVGIMDSALMKVNIPWKYLSCFSAACFFIGSKWVEDDYQPTVPVLAELHYKQWKEVDLRRMEEKILEVLRWEMPKSTYLSFLPQMTEVFSRCHSNLPPPSQVIRIAELLLLKEFSFMLKPAAVALGTLEYCSRQSGAFTQDMSQAVVALQDLVEVLDSELHKINEVLSAEDKLQQEPYKSNKAYFPKVFETPSDSFCPDYRLYDIPEECSDSESDLRSKQNAPVCYRSNPNASVSDYDYSDEENDEPTSNTVECMKDRICKDYTVVRDSVGKQIGIEQTFLAVDVNEHDQSVQHGTDCEQVFSLVQNSAQGIITAHSSNRHSIPPDRIEGYFSDDDIPDEHDSGCEQDSDEQDSCGEQDSCEQDLHSEQDCSEQDSGCDQDSDDCSPVRPCHHKPCVNEIRGQALSFNL